MTTTHPEQQQAVAIKTEDQLNNAGSLFNWLLGKYGLRSDADLARHLCLYPSTISRIRNGKKALGAGNLVQIHEMTGLGIQELRALMITQTVAMNARMIDKNAWKNRSPAI